LEHSHACWNLNPSGIGFIALMSGLVVETRRGVDCLRDPIDHHIRQQFILRENALDLPVTIAPATELLNDPSCQPDGRIVQAIGKCLWACFVQMTIARLISNELRSL